MAANCSRPANPQYPTAPSSMPSNSSESPRPPEVRMGSKHGSKVSVHSVASSRSHQEYIDSLPVPPLSELERIESVQVHKEEEKIFQDLGMAHPRLSDAERYKAAELIQRNYRCYRERRQMRGLGLDSSSRWIEAIKEARYRNLTTPRARHSLEHPNSIPRVDGSEGVENGQHVANRPSEARMNWNKIGMIARRAANDEDSSSGSSAEEGLSEETRQLRIKQKEDRQKSAMTMDLQYWLEMVDVKHRYGANLKTYHQEWQRSNTKENFFYWLDYGEGQLIDCAGCPRERLDRERVRYLSKEERLDYLVKIDNDGRLCWAKDGSRIDTTVEYRDSIHGIVPVESDVPAFKPEDEVESTEAAHDIHSGTSTSGDDEEAKATRNHYATDKFDKAKGVKKVKYVSPATIFNKLLRSSVKKNTWIFVADTNFRLYVGIKQSGVFQHSSFLHGSRISAAGLIKIKNGLLDQLSPLSGHYRPPVSSFRAFVHALKDVGVDMSHVSISRSYGVLVGLEAYVKTRKRGKELARKLIHGRNKLVNPDGLRRRQVEEIDKSESAEREKRLLEMQEESEREHIKSNTKLLRKLHIGTKTPNQSHDRTTGTTSGRENEHTY